jgi:hypothetical protein
VDQARRIDAASCVSAYAANAVRIASLVMSRGVSAATRAGSPASSVAIAIKSWR